MDLQWSRATVAEVDYGPAYWFSVPLAVIAMLGVVMAVSALVGAISSFEVSTASDWLWQFVGRVGMFALWWYGLRSLVWAFPRYETIIATGKMLSVSRRLSGIRVTRRFEQRPGALGVQFEASWNSTTKPRYRLHYESGRQKCDFARGLAEQSARELLRKLIHTESAVDITTCV